MNSNTKRILYGTVCAIFEEGFVPASHGRMPEFGEKIGGTLYYIYVLWWIPVYR
jgi:hypothetical protein